MKTLKRLKEKFKYLPMDIGRLVCSPLLLIYRAKRIKLNGEKYNKHLKGGAVIVSYHTDFADPFILGNCFWYRRFFFLTAKEVMGDKLREALLKGMGCIKIDREISDIDAIRKGIDLLKEGKILGVFPEGGIHKNDHVDKIKGGAVLLALRAEVPIIPVYTQKRKNIFCRQLMVIGEPFYPSEICKRKFPSVADMEEASKELYNKMEETKKAYEQYS